MEKHLFHLSQTFYGVLSTLEKSQEHQTKRAIQNTDVRRTEPRNKPTHLWSKEARIKWEKSSAKWCWESWTAACKSMKLEHTLSLCIKIKWIKDLNIRHDTTKLLEEIIGKAFFDISCTNIYLGQSPKAIEIKTKINKYDLIKLTSFCKANHEKNEKTSYRMGENFCKWCNWQGLNFQNVRIAHTSQQQNKQSKWKMDKKPK